MRIAYRLWLSHKMKRAAIAIIFLFLAWGDIYALSTKNLIAYPVPFNPKKGNVKYITIGNSPSASPLSVDKIVIEVFDINGDPVIKKVFSSTEARWNGRNDNGRLVKPGLYIIKVTAENSMTGDFGKKLIRVLIKY
jgi:flagellar hook assembly protein FlgD